MELPHSRTGSGSGFTPVSSIPLGGYPPQIPVDPNRRIAQDRSRTVGGLLGLIGAVGIVVGSVLERATFVTAEGVSVSGNSWSTELGEIVLGPSLALTAVILALGSAAVVLVPGARLARLAALVAATMAAALATFMAIDALVLRSNVEGQLGAGPPVTLVAAGLAIVGMVMAPSG